MADKNIGLLVAKLNIAIQEGVNLFNDYKELSKEFQEQQKILMNNTELKKELANLKNKYTEEVKITTAQRNVTSLKAMNAIPNSVKAKQFAKATAKLKELKNKYDKNLELIKKKSEISEIYLVNSDKKFLKEKKKINDKKKIIQKKILDIGKEIKSKMDNIEEFKKFVDRIKKRKYEVFNGKTITFDTLMHHLQSGEISNEVSKTTKKIDELMTIGNVVNRKKKMEIGILEKEIKNLLIDYDTTMSSLKKFVAIKYPNKENITNEDVESLLKTKYSKKNSPEFRQKIYNLASKLKKYNSEIKTKMKKLQKLQESS